MYENHKKNSAPLSLSLTQALLALSLCYARIYRHSRMLGFCTGYEQNLCEFQRLEYLRWLCAVCLCVYLCESRSYSGNSSNSRTNSTRTVSTTTTTMYYIYPEPCQFSQRFDFWAAALAVFSVSACIRQYAAKVETRLLVCCKLHDARQPFVSRFPGPNAFPWANIYCAQQQQSVSGHYMNAK